jgi:transcriptional regulator with XRE-family HTH domain
MDRLISLRKEKNISQQKLAEQIGTNQQSIHGYEQGLYEPDIQTLKLLAIFFNTSVDYLVGNTEIRNKIEYVQKFELNENEASVMEMYRVLPTYAQRGFFLLAQELSENINNAHT